MDLRDDFCIVANDNFVYFIGGREYFGGKSTIFTDVDRFEVSRKQWDKAADTKVATSQARGTAVNKKIYITSLSFRPTLCYVWQVYDETTNEWQIITPGVRDGHYCDIAHIPLAVDGELYRVALKEFIPGRGRYPKQIRIERYYPEENKWQTKTKVTASYAIGGYFIPAIVCSMRIFQGLFNMRRVESFPFDDSSTSRKREQKCLIM